ncbi:hypothetical protein H6503_03025 [Candidatus Woesearchaeota archaeon]|nr:hypothetical protein [Candidatus Woesearchaeota archaeon]
MTGLTEITKQEANNIFYGDIYSRLKTSMVMPLLSMGGVATASHYKDNGIGIGLGLVMVVLGITKGIDIPRGIIKDLKEYNSNPSEYMQNRYNSRII